MYMVQAMGESIQGPSSPFIRDAAAALLDMCQPTLSDIGKTGLVCSLSQKIEVAFEDKISSNLW